MEKDRQASRGERTAGKDPLTSLVLSTAKGKPHSYTLLFCILQEYTILPSPGNRASNSRGKLPFFTLPVIHTSCSAEHTHRMTNAVFYHNITVEISDFTKIRLIGAVLEQVTQAEICVRHARSCQTPIKEHQ